MWGQACDPVNMTEIMCDMLLVWLHVYVTVCIRVGMCECVTVTVSM